MPQWTKMRIPDYITPLEGWRCWHYIFDEESNKIRLMSLNGMNDPFPVRSFWIPGEPMKAHCGHRRNSHPKESPPVQDCSCGVHAAHSFKGLLKDYYEDYFSNERVDDYLNWGEYMDAVTKNRVKVFSICGKVAMWGKVVRGDKAMRGLYCYPSELYVDHRGVLMTSRTHSDEGPPMYLERGIVPASRVAKSLEIYNVPVKIVDIATDLRGEDGV